MWYRFLSVVLPSSHNPFQPLSSNSPNVTLAYLMTRSPSPLFKPGQQFSTFPQTPRFPSFNLPLSTPVCDLLPFLFAFAFEFELKYFDSCLWPDALCLLRRAQQSIGGARSPLKSTAVRHFICLWKNSISNLAWNDLFVVSFVFCLRLFLYSTPTWARIESHEQYERSLPLLTPRSVA